MRESGNTGDEGTGDHAGVVVPPSAAGDHERQLIRQRLRASLFSRSPEPTRVGRFVLVDKLGAGGMGVVYRAYDPHLQREVALKLLAAGDGSAVDARGHDRLLREARMMASLSHPNIVPIFEVGEHEGAVFLAMELIDGQTLEQWLGAARTERQVLEMFVGAGQGLAAAHAAGVVHRDFKPANVLVGKDGRPRVLDFGLARRHEDEDPGCRAGEGETEAPSGLTRTGTILGTPAYMSPEQFDGETVDARSDQFSLCVAVWEALFGESPFAGETYAERSESVRSGELREPTRRVPGRTLAALRRGLARDPAERFANLPTLLAQLSPPRRPSPWWGVLALTIALGGAVFLFRDERQPCGDEAVQLQGVWDRATRQEIEARIRGSSRDDADSEWARTSEALDEWVASWVEAARENCEATRVRGAQPEATMLVRASCLDARLQTLRGLSGGLLADPRFVSWSAPMARMLPDVSGCVDAKAAELWPPLPEDPTLRARAQRLRRAVALLDLTFHFDNELLGDAFDELADEVEATDDGPLLARFLLAQGRAAANASSAPQTVALLERTYLEAERVGDDRTAAHAASYAALHLAQHGRRAEAARWGELALAKAKRSGSDDELVIAVRNRLTWVPEGHEDRITAAREVVDQADRLLAADHPLRASPKEGLATHFEGASMLDEAEEAAHAFLAAAVRATGQSSVQTLDALRLLTRIEAKQGACATAIERLDGWQTMFDDVREGSASTLATIALDYCGHTTPWLSLAARTDGSRDLGHTAAVGLAYHFYRRRNLDGAHRALRMARSSDPLVILLEAGLAARAGDRSAALAGVARAADLGRTTVFWLERWRAQIHWELGETSAALEAAEGAQEAASTVPTHTPFELAELDWLLGRLRVEAGNHAGAVAPLRRSLDRVEAMGEQAEQLYFVPDARSSLARALWEVGQPRDEARQLARHAIEQFAELGERWTADREATAAWLAARDVDAP